VKFGLQKVAVGQSSHLTLYFPSNEQRHSIEHAEHFSIDEINVTHKFNFQNLDKLQQRSLMLPAGKSVNYISEKWQINNFETL
jgi:hypothetical protein